MQRSGLDLKTMSSCSCMKTRVESAQDWYKQSCSRHWFLSHETLRPCKVLLRAPVPADTWHSVQARCCDCKSRHGRGCVGERRAGQYESLLLLSQYVGAA